MLLVTHPLAQNNFGILRSLFFLVLVCCSVEQWSYVVYFAFCQRIECNLCWSLFRKLLWIHVFHPDDWLRRPEIAHLSASLLPWGIGSLGRYCWWLFWGPSMFNDKNMCRQLIETNILVGSYSLGPLVFVGPSQQSYRWQVDRAIY